MTLNKGNEKGTVPCLLCYLLQHDNGDEGELSFVRLSIVTMAENEETVSHAWR